MNYENKYNDALEKLQEALAPKDGREISGLTRNCIEEIFPELKESEDERIRKALITYFQRFPYPYGGIESAGTNAKDALAWLEKQGNKPQGKSAFEAIKEEKVDNKNCATDKVEPKFKVKYAGNEYNVLETKEFPGGVTYYGIEDEANHIDYILPENCEIISGYGVKEKGNSYPTKPTIFSQQSPAWSEEDEKIALSIEQVMNCASLLNLVSEKIEKVRAWLESLRPQKQWKPNKEQLNALDSTLQYSQVSHDSYKQLNSLYNDLKKLTK